MFVAMFFLVLSFAEPQEPAMRTLNLYDVRDFFQADDGFDALLGVEPDDLVHVVAELISGDAGASVEIRAGALLVRAASDEQERIRRFLTAIRTESGGSCGVVAMFGSVPVGRFGDPTEGIRIVPFDSTREFHARTEGGPDKVTVLPGSDGSRPVEMEDVTFLQGEPMRPLHRFDLRDTKVVRYVESFESVTNVEGYPDGLAVPKVAEVEEGLVLKGYFWREPAASDVVRLRVELQSTSIERPMARVDTPSGPTFKPVVRTRTLETEVTVPLDSGFFVVTEPSPGEATESIVLVCITAPPK